MIKLVLATCVITLLSTFGCVCVKEEAQPVPTALGTEVKLPPPRHEGTISVEEALLKRRSIREYTGEPLTLQEVSQLVWAGQGVTDPHGLRTAPSAGATYPLETYLVVGEVDGLSSGVYRYSPEEHKLVKVIDGDLRHKLAILSS